MSDTPEPDGRESKRRRVTLACAFCRSRKSKCNGARPSCSTCEAQGIQCEYASSTKKRGQPAGQVHHLIGHYNLVEAILGFLISTVEPMEQLISQAIQIHADRIRNNMYDFRQTWQQSGVYPQFDQLFAEIRLRTHGAQSSIRPGSMSATTTGMEAESDELSFTRISCPAQEMLQSTDQLTLKTIRPESSMGHNASGESSRQPWSEDSRGVVGKILLPPSSSIMDQDLGSGLRGGKDVGFLSVFRQLLDPDRLHIDEFPPNVVDHLRKYFSSVHPLFPILDKFDLMQYLHGTEDRSGFPDKTAVIWAACALYQNLYSHKETGPQAPNRALGWDKFSVLKILMVSMTAPERFSHVQVLILLALSFIQEGYWICGRDIAQLGCSIAINLKLFKSLSVERSVKSQDNSNEHKRVWLACLLADTFIAARFGTVPSILIEDCDVLMLDESGWEEWDSWVSESEGGRLKSPARIASIYNQFLRLLRILNRSLAWIHSFRGSEPIENTSSVAGYQWLAKNLGSWKNGLPNHLANELLPEDGSSDDLESVPLSVPYILNLNIAYHSIRSLLLRSYLLNLSPARLNGEIITTHEDALIQFVQSCTIVLQLLKISTSALSTSLPLMMFETYLTLADPTPLLEDGSLVSVVEPDLPRLRTLSEGFRSLLSDASLGAADGTSSQAPSYDCDSNKKNAYPSASSSMTSIGDEIATFGTRDATLPQSASISQDIVYEQYLGAVPPTENIIPAGEINLDDNDIGMDFLQSYPRNDPASFLDFIENLGYMSQESIAVAQSRRQDLRSERQVSDLAPLNHSSGDAMDIIQVSNGGDALFDQDGGGLNAPRNLGDLETMFDQWIAETTEFIGN